MHQHEADRAHINGSEFLQLVLGVTESTHFDAYT